MSSVEIRTRNGWKYAVIRPGRGGGNAIVKRLGTKSDEEARQLIRDARLDEIATAARANVLTREVWTRLVAGRNRRFRDAAEAYITHRTVTGTPAKSVTQIAQTVDRFLRSNDLMNQSVAACEAQHVAAFVNAPGPQKLSTRQHGLVVINGFFTWLLEQRWIVRNPCVDVRVRVDTLTQAQLLPKPHQPFTDEEARMLLSKTPRTSFWHGAILISFHYGLRIEEVATLEEGNVVANRLRVFTRKGGKTVDEPLEDEIVAWLDEWKKVRPASDLPYLFPEQAAISLSGSSLLSKQFRRLCDRHGLRHVSFHGLRKTASARRWRDALQDLGSREAQMLAKLVAEQGYRNVQKMLGHALGSDVTDKHYLPKAM